MSESSSSEAVTANEEVVKEQPSSEEEETPVPDSNVVLVAVDMSEEAEQALTFYLENLMSENDFVYLIHCPELSEVSQRLMKNEPSPFEDWLGVWDWEQAKWGEVQDKFELFVKTRKVKNFKFSMHPSNNPGETIVSIAEKHKVKMVVMGTRGQGLLRRTIMGSVSDYVLHHVDMPVFIYRDSTKD